MSDGDFEKSASVRTLQVSTFSRVKDLVRELEDLEKQQGRDFANAEVEFRLNPGELAWYVAYKTSAASLTAAGLSRDIGSKVKR
jgi:hypothetical protein